MANQRLWDRVAQFPVSQTLMVVLAGTSTANPIPMSGVRAQKMTPNNDPEAFINAFERTAVMAGWPLAQWSTILIPCPIRPAQQATDTLPIQVLCYYKKVKAVVLHRPLTLIQKPTNAVSMRQNSARTIIPS